NLHPSFLPKYTAPAPIHHTIIHTQQQTPITIIYILKKLHPANIISQQSIPIQEQHNLPTIHHKLTFLPPELLNNTLPTIIHNTNHTIPQHHPLPTFPSNIPPQHDTLHSNITPQPIHN
ncbi:formyltransferase family protein, partial [Staphylococcus epidermidis]|uniref:formyltransferase family protein n=1 Tax=Staphylococcus epidermidis TaxID=1282 RepID=UPI0021B167B1